MKSIVRLSIWGLVLAGVLTAADNPFVGTWKLDPAKSSFTGDTLTYTSLGNGEMKFEGGGFSFTFKADGKPRPTMLGDVSSCEKVDNNTWKITHKTNGKLTGSDMLKLSDDGNTLTDNFHGIRANGETYDNTAVYKRQSPGEGLAGKWKSTKVEMGSPETLVLKDYEGDGISISSPAEKFTFAAKFDGKEYPAVGPTIPKGASGTVRREGPNSFEITEIYKGKPFWKGSYKIADDKQTLTVSGSMVGANEPIKAVYDRQ